MSSATCLNLDQSKVLSSGNGLRFMEVCQNPVCRSKFQINLDAYFVVFDKQGSIDPKLNLFV